jgi:hypothetical protein
MDLIFIISRIRITGINLPGGQSESELGLSPVPVFTGEGEEGGGIAAGTLAGALGGAGLPLGTLGRRRPPGRCWGRWGIWCPEAVEEAGEGGGDVRGNLLPRPRRREGVSSVNKVAAEGGDIELVGGGEGNLNS